MTTILYEDDVVAAVCRELEAHGWTIESRALATQTGDDIIATKGARRLVVEAKGAGSSKEGTKRFGSLFTGNQAKTHVSVALFRALTMECDERNLAAVAFPNNRHHRDLMAKAAAGVQRAGIGTFWVADDLGVELDAPWSY